MISAVKACADLLNRVITDTCPTPWYITPARCGVARCGASYCAKEDGSKGNVYAGMLPTVMCKQYPTAALTEELGGPADQRQRFDWAFDNPSFTLHIVGDELTALDGIADTVIGALDGTGHYDTMFGTINGIRINPPKRTVRNDRPRYDVQLLIEMEMARA
jgi:hypothetical protein